jgi:histidyl-tRNA synthetase
LNALGIEATLLLNSIGDRACRPAYLERLEAWLDEHSSELDAEARHKRETSPLRVFDTKNLELAALLEGAPTIGGALCAECREHFEAVKTFLDACGVAYEVAPRLVRGLDYYTRTAFEFVAPGLGAQDTVSAGGRYDYLVETIGGPPTPAVGFASGIERIVLSAGQGEPVSEPGIDVFFITGENANKVAVVREMSKLRPDFSCDMDYAGRSAKGQWTQASRLGAKWVANVMGDNAIVAYRDDQQAYAKGEDLRTTKLPIPITEVASYIRQREER